MSILSWAPTTYAAEDKRETVIVDRFGKPLVVRAPRPVGFRPPEPKDAPSDRNHPPVQEQSDGEP